VEGRGGNFSLVGKVKRGVGGWGGGGDFSLVGKEKGGGGLHGGSTI